MEEGMPGSVADEGGVEKDSGILEKEVPFKVEINGDLTHDEQLEKGWPGADETGVEGADELSPGSVGPSPTEAVVNGGVIRAEEVSALQDSVPAESPPVGVIFDANSASMPVTRTKGYGLRRWRRIRRDSSKDGGSMADAGRILKRGLSTTEPSKANNENKQKNQLEVESSVASVDSWNMQSRSISTASIRSLEPELELLGMVGGFSVGVDLESSDDRSSRFSTVASALKSKHEGLRYGNEKNRIRNFGGKGSGHAVQPQGQRGKGAAFDITKKLIEDQVTFEKENSHSSVESDLRSSDTVFAEWGSTTSNGRQSEGSLNSDGEDCDDVQVSEEVQAGIYKETGGDVDCPSGDDPHADMLGKDKMEASKNCPPHEGRDPLFESITLLQVAHEALEKEIQKFGEVGMEPTSLSGCSSPYFDYEGTEGRSSLPTELKLIKLSQKVEHLEHELKEATSTVQAKETRVIELETILNVSSLPEGLGEKNPPQETFHKMELELESFFRKKIEAEVEDLIIKSMVQKKRMIMGDPLTFVEQQQYLAEGYEEVKAKLNAAEDRVILLKRQLEELDVSCKDLMGTKEVLKLQNGVCKFSLCCFVQFTMFFVALALFLLQLLRPSGGVVPT